MNLPVCPQHQLLATGCVGAGSGVGGGGRGVNNFPGIHLQDKWLPVAKGIFQRNVQVGDVSSGRHSWG